jgi:hypothetical protein
MNSFLSVVHFTEINLKRAIVRMQYTFSISLFIFPSVPIYIIGERESSYDGASHEEFHAGMMLASSTNKHSRLFISHNTP